MKDALPVPRELKAFANDRQLCVVRFSPCGLYAAAGAMEGTVRRWKVEARTPPAPVDPKKPDKPPKDFSPVELVPLPHLRGFNGWVQTLAFHPKDKRIFCADTWGRLSAFNYEAAEPKPLWENAAAHEGWIRRLAISPDGAHLATCGRDQWVRIWTTEGKLLAEHRAEDDVFAVTFAPAGPIVAFGDARGRVQTWDFKTKQKVREFDASAFYKLSRLQDVTGLRTLTFAEGGRSLLAGGCEPAGGGFLEGAPLLMQWDTTTGKKEAEWRFGAAKDGFVMDVATHPDGTLILATSGQPGSGKILFLRLGEKEPYFAHTTMANCHSVALHPDGRRFAVVSMNRASAGNGRPKTADGSYPGNQSPVHLFEIPS